MDTITNMFSSSISKMFLWAVPPVIVLFYSFARPLKNKSNKNNILLKGSIMSQVNTEIMDGKTVPIETFVTYSENDIPFIHLNIKMPQLCAYEYCISDSKSRRIKGAYVDSTDTTDIVFPIQEGEFYIFSLKLATNEKREEKTGLALIADIVFGDEEDTACRKVYSPFCDIIYADKYLKKTVNETTKEEEDISMETDDEFCPISNVNLSHMSLKRRDQHLTYMRNFRKATSHDIRSATNIQKVVRGYLTRKNLARRHRAAKTVQNTFRTFRKRRQEEMDNEYEMVTVD